MASETDTTDFVPLVSRLERDSRFVAWALATYRDQFRLTPRGLAKELGCDVSMLTSLALCRAPRESADARQFQVDTQAIAQFVGCDWRQLIRVIRAVTALSTLQQWSDPADVALLKAARKSRTKRSKGKSRNK